MTRVVLSLVVGTSLTGSGRPASSAPAQASKAAADDDTLLLSRVRDYLALRRAAERSLPKLRETASPSEISERERLLAASVRKARPGAREGDILGVARARLVQAVRDDWQSRSAAERAGLMAELPTRVPPGVNEMYPSGLPLVTVPASLLDRLPALPEELEYRLFGRHLLLRDVKANLVVDVLRDVVAGPGSAKDAA